MVVPALSLGLAVCETRSRGLGSVSDVVVCVLGTVNPTKGLTLVASDEHASRCLALRMVWGPVLRRLFQ